MTTIHVLVYAEGEGDVKEYKLDFYPHSAEQFKEDLHMFVMKNKRPYQK